MAAGIGLGLGLGLAIRDEGPQIIREDFPSSPPRPSRGPRSLGIRGSFVSSPSATLPRTLYTRDPDTNPLIPFSSSPNLDVPLAQSNPSLHLRTMRKRSIAARHFGLSDDGGLEPFHANGSPAAPPVEAQDSPTIAPSPTMSSTPLVPATPTAEVVEHATHPFLAASVALSVVLGLVILGLGSWLTFVYRRRVKRRRQAAISDDTSGKAQAFSSSNIAEKGMRRSSVSSSQTVRTKSIISQGGYSDGRRVSFIDMPIHTESFMDLHDRLHAFEEARDAGEIPRTRMRSSTLSNIERSLVSSRPTSGVTISTLDPIEEESASVRSESPVASRPQTPERTESRPGSMASTTTRSSAYTTASARSSISDLTTLSTISCLSAFPETPIAAGHTPPLPYESPVKETWGDARKGRARSQTVVNVKSVDLLRTAVGRTMSLQPSKQVANALQHISNVEEAQVLAELVRGREGLLFSPPSPEPVQTIFVEDAQSAFVERYEPEEGDTTLVEDAPESPRPINGMSKVFYSPESKPLAMAIDDETPTSSPVTRSRSFPSKLLSRRNSAPRNAETRRSEVISGGYLKRTLRALRGEDDMPPMPGAFMPDFSGRSSRRDSADSTSTAATASTSHGLDDVAFALGWDDDSGTPEFDAYYTHDNGGFDVGEASDEEAEAETGSVGHELPHIRVTSH